MTKYIWEFLGRYTKTTATATEDRAIVFTVPNQAIMNLIYGGWNGILRTTTSNVLVYVASPHDGHLHKIFAETALADGVKIPFPDPDSLSSWGVMLPYIDIAYPNQLVFEVKDWKADEVIQISIRAYISLNARPSRTVQARVTETTIFRNYLAGVTDG